MNKNPSTRLEQAERMQRRLTLELIVTLLFLVSIFPVMFLAIEVSAWYNFLWIVPLGLAGWKLLLANRWEKDIHDLTGRHW